MRPKRIAIALAVACQLGMSGVACASETITFSYDAKGRFYQVVHAGSVNDTLTSLYTLDPADNRTNVNTTGPSAVVIVPLGAFPVIPIGAASAL